MLQSLIDLAFDTGFFYVDWRMIVMWLVVLVLLYLAVFKEFEPLLLVPIAFGALLANLPTEGVTNKPDSPIIAPADGIVLDVFAKEGDLLVTLEAMKMSTPINSDRAGTVSKIYVSAGQSVQEGQPLIAIA